VHVGRQRIDVAAKECALLVHLTGEPTRVYTKQALLRDVWGHRWPSNTRMLDARAVRLRRKLNAAGGTWVQNVWGVGYRLTRLAPADTGPSAA
jgi:DNA-binding response OmpR family regulator